MRILQLHTRYREVGGEDAVVAAEADLLRTAGHEVEQVLASNPEGALAALTSLAAAPWNPRAARTVRRAAAARDFDVAHVHNTWFAQSPAAIAALDRLGLPVIMSLHNFRLLCANALLLRDGGPCELCVGSHPWHGVRYRCYKDSYPASLVAAGTIALNRRFGTWTDRVRLFLAPSEFVRTRHVAAGFPPDRIVVKRHFTAGSAQRTQPPSASTTLLYVGRLAREKGVQFLLDVWRHHAPEHLELEIIGSGPLADQLELRPPPGVRFAGRLTQAEVHDRMRSARALLLPSLCYETSSLVALEALEAGLPVLASGLGALVEAAGPLGEDWLVPPADAQAWAGGLRNLTDDARIDRAGAAARAAHQASYTREGGLRALEAAYEAVTAAS